jgi:Domain of unknown function (DUF1905)/Bacteriocin-protection, YdeI or OmpD-Associated
MTARVAFAAPVLLVGVNPYVVVDAAHVTTLKPGWRRPLPVLVRVNAGPPTPWRTNLMPVGDGSFRLYLHGAMRRAATADVGDTVHVELEVDRAYHSSPAHSAPDWFLSALRDDSVAQENWERLSPSRRKDVVRYLGSLQTRAAQERNLQRALHVLRGGEGRFVGRAWCDGR